MPTKPMDQHERVRRAVVVDSTSGCWVWTLGKDAAGYGRVRVSLGSRNLRRNTSAHRYAWELWRGPIPHDMNVLHRCDNRSCCNPEHLWLGTQAENLKDMYAKGRGPKGYSRNPDVRAANARKRRSPAP